MEPEFEKNKIKLWEIVRVNNSFLIFSTGIQYPHNLTVYKAEACLIRKGVLLVAGGCVASYGGVYC